MRPLPHYRVGGKILVKETEFDAWLAQFRVQVSAASISTLVNDVVRGLV